MKRSLCSLFLFWLSAVCAQNLQSITALFASSDRISASREGLDAAIFDKAIASAIAEEKSAADGLLAGSRKLTEEVNKASITIGELSDPEILTACCNKTIEIRGFLYEKDGTQFLAQQPGLKSCCIGLEQKKREQIAVYGLPSSSVLMQAITLQGVFHYDSEFQIRSLVDATIITEKQPFPTLLISLIGIMAAAGVSAHLYKRKKG